LKKRGKERGKRGKSYLLCLAKEEGKAVLLSEKGWEKRKPSMLLIKASSTVRKKREKKYVWGFGISKRKGVISPT